MKRWVFGVVCFVLLLAGCRTTNYLKVQTLALTDLGLEAFGTNSVGWLTWVTISNPTTRDVKVLVDCGRGRTNETTVEARSDERISVAIGTGTYARKWSCNARVVEGQTPGRIFAKWDNSLIH